MDRRWVIGLLIVVAGFLAGCNTNGCLENRNSVPLAGFYSSTTGKSVALPTLTVYGVGMPEDAPLMASGSAESQLYLPMRSTEQSTSWVFAYKQKDLDDPELNDTIAFEYSSTPYFVSNECGVIYKYHIERMSYTTHLMDSVVITDSIITNVDSERIKIYFRTGK